MPDRIAAAMRRCEPLDARDMVAAVRLAQGNAPAEPAGAASSQQGRGGTALAAHLPGLTTRPRPEVGCLERTAAEGFLL
jgi:hypothetical protein